MNAVACAQLTFQMLTLLLKTTRAGVAMRVCHMVRSCCSFPPSLKCMFQLYSSGIYI